MRYYNGLNLLFIHIPRTGGQAIKTCMEENLVHRYKEWECPHMRLTDVIRDLPQDVRMFTVWRDEEDRFQSYLKYKTIKGEELIKQFIPAYYGFYYYVMVGGCMPDNLKIARFTHLIEDLNSIMDGFNINVNFNHLKKINSSS